MAPEPTTPAGHTRADYRAPEVCDVDVADDREFHVVAGPTPPSENVRN